MAKNNELVEQREIADRRKEVVDRCLSTLIEKGLAETSVRDLSGSLQLTKAGIYWYFKDKDDVIVVCAEEAVRRLESELIIPVLSNTQNPNEMWGQVRKRADEMAPTMRFFAQVCSTPKYRTMMVPVLSRLSERYKIYATKFADKLRFETAKFESYFYMCITAVSNYMIFNNESFLNSQMKLIERMIEDNKRNELL